LAPTPSRPGAGQSLLNRRELAPSNTNFVSNASALIAKAPMVIEPDHPDRQFHPGPRHWTRRSGLKSVEFPEHSYCTIVEPMRFGENQRRESAGTTGVDVQRDDGEPKPRT
jgi:hypothetical protein